MLKFGLVTTPGISREEKWWHFIDFELEKISRKKIGAAQRLLRLRSGQNKNNGFYFCASQNNASIQTRGLSSNAPFCRHYAC